jgi:hypothetical protein
MGGFVAKTGRRKSINLFYTPSPNLFLIPVQLPNPNPNLTKKYIKPGFPDPLYNSCRCLVNLFAEPVDAVYNLKLGRDWFNYCIKSVPDAKILLSDDTLPLTCRVFSSSPFSAVLLYE